MAFPASKSGTRPDETFELTIAAQGANGDLSGTGTARVPTGATSVTVRVEVVNDTTREDDETHTSGRTC